jgi:vacuolar-type H+-ATPase subunit E/Vma4
MNDINEKADIINGGSAKLAFFRDTISADAEESAEATVKGANKFRDSTLNETREKELSSAYSEISAGTKEIKAELRAKVAKKSFEYRADVLKTRADLTETFFKDLADKLRNFAATDKYNVYLVNALYEIIEEYPLYEGCVIYARAQDITKIPTQNGAEIKSDENIKVGGLSVYYPKQKLYCDKTFDRGIENKRIEFCKNADISI